MARILVGTAAGLHAIADGRVHEVPGIGWDPQTPASVNALAAAGPDALAIVDRHQLWRSDGGEGWSHVLAVGNLELECVADTDAGILVGTSEAHLARVGEPPTPLETVAGFDRVAGRDEWFTPWGGPPATRSIAEAGGSVFVNVHVGGIVRSRDRGGTWEPTIEIEADVHRVWAGEPDVFAACALGLAVSEDDGDAWRIEDEGLHATYCRGVTVCGGTVLVSASDGPRGGHAAVYRRAVDGGPLERCRDGLPEWLDGNVDSSCLDATPELVAFGTVDGRVFASASEGATWDEVAAGLPSIQAVLVLP